VKAKVFDLLHFFIFVGELLQTLTHDKLPTNTAGAPSIQDGVLAIPGWGDNNLCLFKLEF